MAIPKILLELKALQDKHKQFVSGSFELAFEGKEAIEPYLPGSRARLAEDFLPIGQDGSGSILALWKRPGSDHPVVCFGSEGERKVIAASLNAFLQLLLMGQESVAAGGLLSPPQSEELVPAWAVDFLSRAGIHEPLNPLEIYERANELRREFLAAYFDVILVFAQHYQFYVTSRAEGFSAPVQIHEEDIKAGIKAFDGGLAFYVEDRDNLDVEVNLDFASEAEMAARIAKSPSAYSSRTEFIEVRDEGLWVSGTCDLPVRFQAQIPPGIFKAFHFQFSPGEKYPHNPAVVYLTLVRQSKIEKE